MSVKSAIGEYGNPFLETSSDILVLDTRDIVEKSGVYNVYRMESQGCQQYYNLYANGSCIVTKKNNIHYIHTSDRNIFSRLFVASQFRDGDLNDYFSHKNQPCPSSWSAREKLKLGTKSGSVQYVEDAPEKQDDITPSVDVVM